MAKSTTVSVPVKDSSTPPSMTRGLRRQQAKTGRRREVVPTGALVVGIDLGRERQAVSFVINGEVIGRRRLNCEPHHRLYAGGVCVAALFPHTYAGAACLLGARVTLLGMLDPMSLKPLRHHFTERQLRRPSPP